MRKRLPAAASIAFLVLFAAPASASNIFKRKKKNNKKKKKKATRFPPREDGEGRCSDDTSILELITCTSGDDGFDRNKKDFDIIREIVIYLGITNLFGDDSETALSGITLFLPNDRSFHKIAEECGYSGSYDEQDVVDFLLEDSDIYDIGALLLYHLIQEELSFDELWDMDGEELETLNPGRVIIPDRARTVRGVRRLRIIDENDSIPQAKIHNMFHDLSTSNGKVHVIKNVLSL